MFLNFLLLVDKMRASDLVHFFEDGTKLKIPSEIDPPFTPQLWLHYLNFVQRWKKIKNQIFCQESSWRAWKFGQQVIEHLIHISMTSVVGYSKQSWQRRIEVMAKMCLGSAKSKNYVLAFVRFSLVG